MNCSCSSLTVSGHAEDPLPVKGVCPNCGYCPCCGRGGYQQAPYWPTYPPNPTPSIPYWPGYPTWPIITC